VKLGGKFQSRGPGQFPEFVVEGSGSGMLYALDAATGSLVWSTNVGTAISQPDELQQLVDPAVRDARSAGRQGTQVGPAREVRV